MRCNRISRWIAPSLAVAALIFSLSACTDSATEPVPLEEVPQLAFVGSQSCQECHITQNYFWRQSGHPYKLVKITNGQPPKFPYTEVPVIEGYTWDDISYVIGGYGYKSRYIGKDGFIITKGGKNQWDLNTLAWSDYNKDRETKYDCGGCHTTGYSPQGNQGGMPGIVGTWKEDGVGCEACHGEGSQHAFSPLQYRMKIDRSVEACASCHNRNGATNREITAQNGFLMHRDALHSMWNTRGHKDMTCVTCHEVHGGALFSAQRQRPAVRRSCESAGCHTTKRTELRNGGLKASKANADCTTCHMAPMTVSAVPTKRPWLGDMKSHLVKINTDPSAPQWYGTNNNRSHPYITVGFACLRCHEDKTAAWAGEWAKKAHRP
jgi:hypothetical protein